MNWIKKVLGQRDGEDATQEDVSSEMESHLMELRSFIQESYKPVCEDITGILEQVDWIRNVSDLERKLEERQATTDELVTKITILGNNIGDNTKAIKSAARKNKYSDIDQLLDDTKEITDEVGSAIEDIEEVVENLKAVVEKANDVIPGVKEAVAGVAESVEGWHSREQDLIQMVERGLVLVSSTAINNVAEGFRKSVKRQNLKIIWLWSGVIVTMGVGALLSWLFWKDVNNIDASIGTIIRFPVLGGLTTLVVFFYRAIKPAEQERKHYEMQSNILTSSMAVHKESLSASLQKVLAEVLGWKSKPNSLSVYLQDDKIVCVENLLPDPIGVDGYEVVCWDKNNRRMVEYSYQFSEGEVLDGHGITKVITEMDEEGCRIELRDKERNIVSEYVITSGQPPGRVQ